MRCRRRNVPVGNQVSHVTGCPWKGTASHYSVSIGDQLWENVAGTYHQPKDAAKEILDHVAFYSQVTVS